MDTDLSGKISFPELKRVLNGENFRTVTADFNHPDCGIIWEIDSDLCVSINKTERGSPAAANAVITKGLRLVSINDQPVPQNDASCLSVAQSILEDFDGEPIKLDFIEPLVRNINNIP